MWATRTSRRRFPLVRRVRQERVGLAAAGWVIQRPTHSPRTSPAARVLDSNQGASLRQIVHFLARRIGRSGIAGVGAGRDRGRRAIKRADVSMPPIHRRRRRRARHGTFGRCHQPVSSRSLYLRAGGHIRAAPGRIAGIDLQPIGRGHPLECCDARSANCDPSYRQPRGPTGRTLDTVSPSKIEAASERTGGGNSRSANRASGAEAVTAEVPPAVAVSTDRTRQVSKGRTDEDSYSACCCDLWGFGLRVVGVRCAWGSG